MHPHADCPRLPVLGAEAFPVRRILCIGRNYRAHAAEMGADPRQPPFHFAKAVDALFPVPAAGADWPLPPRSDDVHPEVELVVALVRGGRDLDAAAAAASVAAAGVGLDVTRRDVQAAAKAKGRPWAAAKDFDASAVVGPMVPVSTPPVTGAITLAIDGRTTQRGDLADMTWSVVELVQALSRWMTVRPGDLVFTGTPAGVGQVQAGQRLVGSVDGLPPLRLHVVGP